jgi:hypothetical protein
MQGNTACATMNNPRNGYQSCADVYAHPADVAEAVILFARSQCTCPTEVQMSTVWPEGMYPDILRAAQHLIKRHGADAPIVAAQRAVELLNENDLDEVDAAVESMSNMTDTIVRPLIVGTGPSRAGIARVTKPFLTGDAART